MAHPPSKILFITLFKALLITAAVVLHDVIHINFLHVSLRGSHSFLHTWCGSLHGAGLLFRAPAGLPLGGVIPGPALLTLLAVWVLPSFILARRSEPRPIVAPTSTQTHGLLVVLEVQCLRHHLLQREVHADGEGIPELGAAEGCHVSIFDL